MTMMSGVPVLSPVEVVWAVKVAQGVLAEEELPDLVSVGEVGAVGEMGAEGTQVAPVVRVVEEGLEALAPV
jgi:hypothetical protein